MRQYDPGPGVSISSLAYDYPPAWRVPEHEHESDQLIYAVSGVMEVVIGQTLWLIPPQFALWIPAHVRHSIRMPASVAMRTLYIRPGLARKRANAVLHVTPLLRELIVEAVRVGEIKTRNKDHAAFRHVLMAQIAKASPIPTRLAMPSDDRARALAEAVIANPAAPRKMQAQCREIGLSVRTMQRIFHREVGTDFETWRRQARLMKAVELLASQRRIKEIAFAVGYRQASTFVALFRRSFGLTPKAWISTFQSERGGAEIPPRPPRTRAVPPVRASAGRRRLQPQPRVNARTTGESRRN
jgi:AraC-like DNA-binding protein/quercetin dioxygenase-like cupin family protein